MCLVPVQFCPTDLTIFKAYSRNALEFPLPPSTELPAKAHNVPNLPFYSDCFNVLDLADNFEVHTKLYRPLFQISRPANDKAHLPKTQAGKPSDEPRDFDGSITSKISLTSFGKGFRGSRSQGFEGEISSPEN